MSFPFSGSLFHPKKMEEKNRSEDGLKETMHKRCSAQCPELGTLIHCYISENKREV